MAREDDLPVWGEGDRWIVNNEDISKDLSESIGEYGERTAHIMVAFPHEPSGEKRQYPVDFDDLLYTSPRGIFKAFGVDRESLRYMVPMTVPVNQVRSIIKGIYRTHRAMQSSLFSQVWAALRRVKLRTNARRYWFIVTSAVSYALDDMLLFMIAARRMLLSNSFRIGFRQFNFKHAFRLKIYTTQQLGVLFGSLPLLDIVGNQSRLVCVRGKMKTGIESTPILKKDTVIILKAVNNSTVDVGFRNHVYAIPTSSVTIEAASMQLGPSSATMTPSPWWPDSYHLRALTIKCRRMIIKTRRTPAPGSEPTPLMLALRTDSFLRNAKVFKHSVPRNYCGFVEPGMDSDDCPGDENSWTAESE